MVGPAARYAGGPIGRGLLALAGVLAGVGVAGADGASFAVPGDRGAGDILAQARVLETRGRYDDAARRYVDLIRREALAPFGVQAIVPSGRDERLYLGAAAVASDRLSSWPKVGRDAFRALYDAEVRVKLERARAARDEAALLGLWRAYPIAGPAYEVVEALGDVALERGRLAEAEEWYAIALQCQKARGDGLNPRRLAGKGGEARRRRGLARARVRERAALAGGAPTSWPMAGGDPAHAQPLPALGRVLRRPMQAMVPPTGAARRWRMKSTPIRPRRFSSFAPRRRGTGDVIPAVADGRAVLRVGGSIACYDLFTGRLRWLQRVWTGRDVPSPTLFSGATIAGGRVFASFVHRLSRGRSYRNIPITEALPTRRLVAFDLRTGKRLWDHAFSDDPFLKVASVALPPVATGGRLYAGAVVTEGALKTYLLCCDQATGRLLWRRYLGTGQVELTMFGNHAVEPLFMMPAVWRGICFHATGMGTVAAVDALRGEVLWIRTYEAMPIVAARGYRAVERSIVWRQAPLLVAEGTLALAPLDSNLLLGLDAITGARRWRLSRGSDRRLLGVFRGAVVLQGLRLRLVDLRSGKLVRLVPTGIRGSLREPEVGQGLIAGRVALVPLGDEVARFDLATGERLPGLRLHADRRRSGSLVYVRSGLLVANPEHLSIYPIEVGY